MDTICFDKTGTLTENRLRLVLSIPAATSPQGPFSNPFLGLTDPFRTDTGRPSANTAFPAPLLVYERRQNAVRLERAAQVDAAEELAPKLDDI